MSNSLNQFDVSRASSKKHTFSRVVGREGVKWILSRVLRWKPLDHPRSGFSIVLGVPWGLRHLLPVNLQFIRRTESDDLRSIEIVFDRTIRPNSEALVARMRSLFPELPLRFHFYPQTAGRLVEAVRATTFYHSLNVVLGLRSCETRFAILHDFDLYPLAREHFVRIVRHMQEGGYYFAGPELTHFDGLTDDDQVLGTWALGVDVAWLREHFRPIDVFPRYQKRNGRLMTLDPTSAIQLSTDRRLLINDDSNRDYCHANHLCGTYLAVENRRPFKWAWRLHLLWYLEYLADRRERFREATARMQDATIGVLTVGGHTFDFRNVHATCANVLRQQVERLEVFLFEECRAEVQAYLGEVDGFLNRHGQTTPIYRDGKLVWCPDSLPAATF